MSPDDLHKLYLRIITAVNYVDVGGITYVIHDPSPLHKQRGYTYYEEIVFDLVTSGVPTEEQSMVTLIQKGLWTKEDEGKVEVLQDNLRKLNKSLSGLEFKSLEKKATLEYIEVTKRELEKLAKRKSNLLSNTAEYLAKLEVYKRYIFWCTFLEDGRKCWNDWKAFTKLDSKFVNDLISQAYLNGDIDEASIRKLARSEPWRSTWLTATKVSNLFNKPLVELTDYQRALCSWSIVYDNALEHPDGPSWEIIENDALFDEWSEAQAEKRKSTNKGVEITNSKIRNSDEIFIMAETPEDAKKVYALNDQMSLNVIKTRENLLEKRGSMKETDMPDVRKKYSMAVTNAFRNHIKERT